MTAPAAVLSTILPVPRWTGSLNVTTMLLPTATAVAPSAGLKLTAVGGVESTALVTTPATEKLKGFSSASLVAKLICPDLTPGVLVSRLTVKVSEAPALIVADSPSTTEKPAGTNKPVVVSGALPSL